VSSPSPSAVPPGWYPDPSGERQWRVWTGVQWSELTRSYGPPIAAALVASDLGLIVALQRLVRYGFVGVYAGLGIVVGVLAHWPGTAHPASRAFAVIASDAGMALMVIGTVSVAFAARELEGHWSAWALVPGVNLMVVNALVTRRLGGRPGRRVVSETVLVALFVVQFHVQPWLAIAPVIVAVGQSRWTSSLIERLTGSATQSSPAAS
jgi:hypothetical protein